MKKLLVSLLLATMEFTNAVMADTIMAVVDVQAIVASSSRVSKTIPMSEVSKTSVWESFLLIFSYLNYRLSRI